ncbi:MAG: hypothetical protein JWM93_36 [Frankiales bacterium]|nr:hypothetical protein [Frankiales bacterium]
MRTTLRLAALLFLSAVAVDVYAVSHRNPALLAAGAALVVAAAGWRDAVVLPAALVAGGLYLVALLVGHVPYESAAVFVGAAIVAYVDLSAWSAATPRHAAVPAGSLLRMLGHHAAGLAVGVGMAWLVIVGRSQASRASIIPWLAGLATLTVALLLPVVRQRVRRAADEG